MNVRAVTLSEKAGLRKKKKKKHGDRVVAVLPPQFACAHASLAPRSLRSLSLDYPKVHAISSHIHYP